MWLDTRCSGQLECHWGSSDGAAIFFDRSEPGNPDAIVKSYIATGEPVGSKYVSGKRKDRLSPASIRNVMAELEETATSRPHASAGRVPTEKAFREYVQHLSTPRLNPDDAGFIQDNLDQATTLEERLGRSSLVLAALTRQMGVAVVAPLSQSVLERVQFTRLGDHRILVVLVARGDVVRHRVIRVAEEIRPEELERLANYVNHEFAGWPLAAVRGEFGSASASNGPSLTPS